MARRFAQDTAVGVGKSQAELVALLKVHGAQGFAFGEQGGVARVVFQIEGRQIRFEIAAPTVEQMLHEGEENAPRIGSVPWWRADEETRRRWAVRECERWSRQRWRALLLVCKAKFEMIASGMGTVQSEFLAHVVLPNGRLVGEWIGPQLAESYESGKMPPLLPGVGGG